MVSAPNINEPIIGGAGQISGNFTTQEASDLAIVLRSGALPAKLTIVEERTVGPSLGSDSIRAGLIASLIGLLGVLVFMIVAYGLFGVFANLALIANLVMLMGLMSFFGFTLTLPGIAGIVLTMGMAVDSNVLDLRAHPRRVAQRPLGAQFPRDGLQGGPRHDRRLPT